MRPIKFRGKRKDNGEWIYGDLCNYGKKIYIFDNSLSPIFLSKFILIESKTVGQFTGLFDKNNKEIYEGDIVLCNGKLSKEKEIKEKRKGQFIWSDLSRGFDVVLLNQDNEWEHYVSMNFCPDKLEVIGNIYEDSNETPKV
jgi:uncharacterized phage protein (TIGR01671 family)